MGFIKENYYPYLSVSHTIRVSMVSIGRLMGNLTLLTLSILILLGNEAISQQACPIKTGLEPTEDFLTRAATNYGQVEFPNFINWDSLSHMSSSNDRYASVALTRYKRSTKIKADKFNLRVPTGALVLGVKITIEGHSEGEGNIKETDIRLLDRNGEPMGDTRRGHGGYKAWSSSDDDILWSYGSETDTWGTTLTSDMVNDPDFGYQIQLKNSTSKDIEVFIDHIIITVYYAPLFTICDHTCVTFFVDEIEQDVTYNWHIPEGYHLLSYSEEARIINMGVTDADFGIYEICVETLVDDVVTGNCCRKFVFEDCNPGAIGDQVWQDNNFNGMFDNGDIGVSGVEVNLYIPNGELQATVITDAQGTYQFTDVLRGDYYIGVDAPQGFIPVFADLGNNDNVDSDITGANGIGTSDVFELGAGQTISNIDIGLSEFIHIGDQVWLDSNGDGIYQDTEAGIENVTISAISLLGPIFTTTTDDEGHYLFGPLPQGDYALSFSASDDLHPTLLSVGSSDLDSDIFNNGKTSILILDTPGFHDDIDAGYYELGTIGNYVWEDTNFNGIQDVAESGLDDVIVKIYNENGQVLDSTVTDTTGFYSFNIPPGKYTIQLSDTRQYVPTIGTASDSLLDSDLLLDGGIFTTDTITLLSGEIRNDIDLGLVDQPSDIGGVVWFDTDADGQRISTEATLADVAVVLYNENEELVESTMTNSAGVYSFTEVFAGSYYVTFDIPSTQLETLPNVGSDDTDSDITNGQVSSSTDLFTVLPGVDDFTIWAGFVNKSSLGDQVWIDLNRNGMLDDSEIGMNDVVVTLLTVDSTIVDLDITSTRDGKSGIYHFSDIVPGSYIIRFEMDDELEFTTPDTVGDDVDSDVVFTSAVAPSVVGETAVLVIAANEDRTDIDAGVLLPFGGVSGRVFVDENMDGIFQNEPLLDSIVVTLYDESQVEIESTLTNASGEYIFPQVMMGNYFVTFATSERYLFTMADVGTDDSLDSDVTGSVLVGSTDIFAVTDGVIIMGMDAGVLDGIGNISGVTWLDNNGNGIQESQEEAIPGVEVKLYSLADSMILDSVDTDVNGRYIFSKLDTGEYYLEFAHAEGSFLNTEANIGVDDTIDDDITGQISAGSTDSLLVQYFNNLENVNAGYYQLASIGDLAWIDLNENHMRDINEVGLDDILVKLLDIDGNTVTSAVTAAGGGLDSGYYLLENIPPGEYRLEFTRVLFYAFVDGDQGNDVADSDVISVEDNRGLTDFFQISSGQFDNTRDVGLFFSIPMVSTIAGSIWLDENSNGLDDNEAVQSGVPVDLYDQDDNLVQSMVTDESGEYLFEMLLEGFYYVKASLNTGVPTVANVGGDDLMDSDFTNANGFGTTDVFFLAVLEDISNIDLGITSPLLVGDYVWEDINFNGLQDDDEPGIEGIKVYIENETGEYLDSTITNADGLYVFDNVAAHRYRFSYVLPASSYFTQKDAGDDNLDSDVREDGSTDVIDLTAGGTDTSIDAGLLYGGDIDGRIWVDFNANGRQGNAEPGFAGVLVSLYDANGLIVDTTRTVVSEDGDGIYSFSNVKPDNYYITFSIPNGYNITDPDKGVDTEDSDITNASGEGSTDVFALESGASISNVDGGIFLPAILGDRVWLDENMDGIQDDGEVGVEGIEVVLFRSAGIPIDTSITDVDGLYRFDGLKQGLYFIDFTIPEMFVVSPADVSGDEATDSDADDTGVTPLISLAHGTELLDVDAGIFQTMTTLRSIAWEDLNADGIRQVEEPRIVDLIIELMDEDGNMIDATVTNSLGKYAFSEIEDGDYYVHVDLADEDYTFTTVNMGDDTIDNDIHKDGTSEMFTVEDGLSVPNVDAGIYKLSEMKMEVWEDLNTNGAYDTEEMPLVNVVAELYDAADGEMLQSIKGTEEAENIVFEKLTPGDYYVKFQVDSDHFGSLSEGEDFEANKNSDLLEIDGEYMTPVFNVTTGETVTYLDAGFYTLDNTNIVSQSGNGNRANLPELVLATDVIKIEVGPNPALYYIDVSDISEDRPIESLPYTVTLNDRTGAIIYRSKVNELKDYRIYLESIQSGIFFLTVNNGNSSVTRTLIKVTP